MGGRKPAAGPERHSAAEGTPETANDSQWETQRDDHHLRHLVGAPGDAHDPPGLPAAAAAAAITVAVTSGLPAVLGSMTLHRNKTLLR